MTAATRVGVRRIIAGASAIGLGLLALGIHPAEAQMGGPRWAPEDVWHDESAGEVVLTLSVTWQDRPARVRYQTVNDDAKAPSDYVAVTGEVVFTEPGSREIKIPIVDDHTIEDMESFTVHAWEEPPVDPFLWRTTATVWIVDDDGDQTSEPAPAAGTRTTTATGSPTRPAASGAPVDATEPATDGVAPSADAASPFFDPEMELAVPETPQAGDFEATDEVGLDRPPASPRSGRASTAAWILASGAAVLSIGVMAWSQRRRRLPAPPH